METVLESYFDIEGTRYDIVKVRESSYCTVVRENVVFLEGTIIDCRRFLICFINALNGLYTT